MSLDGVAEVVEVDSDLSNSGVCKTAEVSSNERDVQIGKERLRDGFGHRAEPDSAARGEEHGLQEAVLDFVAECSSRWKSGMKTFSPKVGVVFEYPATSCSL